MMTGGRDNTKLIETYRSYARAIAAEVLRKVPATVERPDLEGAADLGLVEAAGAFDPERGVLFKTFAYYRIRGAVYDALRKQGWFSKSLYDQFRFEMAANEYMTDYSSAPPPTTSPAASGEQLESLTGTFVSCYMLSLDGVSDSLAEDRVSVEQKMLDDEQRDLVRRALAGLPEKNRRILEEYYYQNKSLEEIGSGFGLSKSWLSRLHAKSLEMLKDSMTAAQVRPTPPAQATSPAVQR